MINPCICILELVINFCELIYAQVGPSLLTPRQLLQAACYYACGRLASFRPRFSEGVQHFLIHAGGAKVIDTLQLAS